MIDALTALDAAIEGTRELLELLEIINQESEKEQRTMTEQICNIMSIKQRGWNLTNCWRR